MQNSKGNQNDNQNEQDQCAMANGKKCVKGIVTGTPVNVSVEDVKKI